MSFPASCHWAQLNVGLEGYVFTVTNIREAGLFLCFCASWAFRRHVYVAVGVDSVVFFSVQERDEGRFFALVVGNIRADAANRVVPLKRIKRASNRAAWVGLLPGANRCFRFGQSCTTWLWSFPSGFAFVVAVAFRAYVDRGLFSWLYFYEQRHGRHLKSATTALLLVGSKHTARAVCLRWCFFVFLTGPVVFL